MLDIREITFDCFWANAGEMIAQHTEVSTNSDLFTINPNLNVYRQMEKAGSLLTIGAWDDGLLIGYSINFVLPHHHSMEVIHCSNDLLFVHPEYRRGRTGLKLISETERLAKKRGAHIVFWRANPGTALEKIMSALGKKVQETVFYTRL